VAFEITFNSTQGILSYEYNLVRQNMIDALYSVNNVLGMLTSRSLVGVASDSQRFPKPPVLAASALVDGTDMTNTAFVPTQTTGTVSEVGLLLELTDLASSSSVFDFETYGSEAGNAVAEKLTTDITGLLGSFSTTGGTPGGNLSEQEWRDGITSLRATKVNEQLFAILHPQQENDLAGSIGSTLTAAATTGGSPRGVTQDLTASAQGMLGDFYGVVTVVNPTVPTANAGADRAGGMFSQKALAYVEKWAIRPETERNISKRSTEIAVTAAYAVLETDDDRGISFITDA
jgi:hypothetical protein